MQNLLTLICVCVWSIILANGIEVDGVASFDVHWQIKENGERLGETCPNNRTRCNDRQTCCITKHGSYHCCRYSNAVCCPDKFHCCPHGSTCDSRTKRCRRREEQYDFNPAKIEEPMEWPVVEENTKTDITNQVCPNNRTKCQDSQTCCITKHGSYHCCKFENAVCCSDKFHCCPQDSTCDLKRHRCEKSMNPMLKLIPSQVVITSDGRERSVKRDHEMKLEGDQTCPNNKTKCKDTKTCCITKYGNYYCCPHKNAVCCSDKYQCCPEDTTCDLKNKKCIKSSFSPNLDQDSTNNIQSKKRLQHVSPIISKRTRHESRLGIMVCPDNLTECFTFQTCCMVDDNSYGCCSYENATCCADKNSCCRHNEKCDLKNNACVPNIQETFSRINEIGGRKSLFSFYENSGLDQECATPGKCLSSQTCCPVGSDRSGCCPYASGVCCSDLKTCCPQGMTCDGNNGGCKPRNSNPTPVRKEVKPFPVKRNSLFSYINKLKFGTICPDNSECPEEETCCPMAGNVYGCCPYSSGVCCPDLKTCCPSGTQCVNNSCA